MTVKKTSSVGVSRSASTVVASHHPQQQLSTSATHHPSHQSPRKRSGHKSSTHNLVDVLRKVTKNLVLADRFDTNPLEQQRRQHRKRFMAPFSSISPYQRVRKLLDPVKDRHLLGGGDDLSSSSLAPTNLSNHHPNKGGSSSKRVQHVRDVALLASHANSAFFDPDVAVTMESVLVPLHHHDDADGTDGRRRSSRRHPHQHSHSSSIHGGHDTARDGRTSEENTARGAVSGESSAPATGRPSQPASPPPTAPGDDDEHAMEVIPDGREVALLPPALALTFFTVALNRLRKLLLPRLLLSSHKRRKLSNDMDMHQRSHRPSSDVLKKSKLFSSWTVDALHQAVSALEYVAFDVNRYLWYAGEPGSSLGITVLGHGTVRLMEHTLRSTENKALTHDVVNIVSTVTGPAVVNDFALLTSEPHADYAKTMTRCDVWCLSKEHFEQCMAMLPESTKAPIAQMAFQRRQRMIPKVYPISFVDFRRQCPTFGKNSDAILKTLIHAMKPLALKEGDTIARAGEIPNHIQFLRRGKVGVLRDINGTFTLVKTLVAPVTIHEADVLHRQENAEIYKAQLDCDLMLLSFDDIQQIFSQNPAERDTMLEVSRDEKMRILSRQQLRLRPLVFQTPIVRHLLESEHISALAHLFEAKVYPPLALIASTAEVCDRIVILTKGSVSFQVKGRTWGPGEAIGFTCLVPHRWEHSAVALTNCECIELKRCMLEAFLEDVGVLDDALHITNALLFPRKWEVEQREWHLQEDHGVTLTNDLRRLHRSGKLPVGAPALSASPLSRSQSTVMDAPPVPQQQFAGHYHHRSASADIRRQQQLRLEHITLKVLQDVEGMETIRMFPVSEALDPKPGILPGFVPIVRGVPVCEEMVPGGLHVPSLTEADKQDLLSKALFAVKRDPVKRVARITPFLIVKQR